MSRMRTSPRKRPRDEFRNPESVEPRRGSGPRLRIQHRGQLGDNEPRGQDKHDDGKQNQEYGVGEPRFHLLRHAPPCLEKLRREGKSLGRAARALAGGKKESFARGAESAKPVGEAEPGVAGQEKPAAGPGEAGILPFGPSARVLDGVPHGKPESRPGRETPPQFCPHGRAESPAQGVFGNKGHGSSMRAEFFRRSLKTGAVRPGRVAVTGTAEL